MDEFRSEEQYQSFGEAQGDYCCIRDKSFDPADLPALF